MSGLKKKNGKLNTEMNERRIFKDGRGWNGSKRTSNKRTLNHRRKTRLDTAQLKQRRSISYKNTLSRKKREKERYKNIDNDLASNNCCWRFCSLRSNWVSFHAFCWVWIFNIYFLDTCRVARLYLKVSEMCSCGSEAKKVAVQCLSSYHLIPHIWC